jgi:hypothetical protein
LKPPAEDEGHCCHPPTVTSIVLGVSGDISMRATQFVLFAMIGWLNFSGISHAQIRNFDGNTLSNLCNTNANRETPKALAMQAGACLGYLSSKDGI